MNAICQMIKLNYKYMMKPYVKETLYCNAFSDEEPFALLKDRWFETSSKKTKQKKHKMR